MLKMRYSVSAYLNFVSYLALMTSHTLSFNLDNENADIFEGARGSGFGFKSTLWQDKNGKKWVVVGAPNLQRELNGSVPYTGIIGGVAAYEDKRKFSLIDTLPILKSKDHGEALKYAMKESLPSIGLGETLFSMSTTNPLLVCSPRNIHLSEPNEIGRNRPELGLRGACYLLNTIHSPPILLNQFPEKQMKNEKLQFQAASDNAGMAAFLSEEYLVLIGLPSMYNFSGGICSYNLRGEPSFKFSRNLQRSNKEDTYEGWAITGGKFDGIHNYFAVSVPGEPTHRGKIIFYSSSLNLVQRHILGQEVGARFGDSLAAGDFNGDGITDLAVSAHLSTVALDSEYSMADAGKVHVYYSPIFNKGKNEMISTLKGMAPKAYFGFSILSPGDLNGDGCDDLVVGAPYEDNGKVYVFNGSPQGIMIQHTQVISQMDLLQRNFRVHRAIGFSLGGGIDIDSNGYPDIMIGALKSDSAILVRSAPVLTLKMKATFNHSDVIKLGEETCLVSQGTGHQALLNCFNMTVEVYYVSQHFKDSLDVNLEIILDTKRSSPRILFYNHENVLGQTRSITNKPKPFNLHVYVKAEAGKSAGMAGLFETGTVPVKPENMPFKHLPTDQPIYAKVRASLPRKVEVHTDQGDSFSSPQIRPKLDPFTDHTIETAVRFICEDPETCLAKPDLFLGIIGNDFFTLGLKENLRLNISLATRDDHAFQVRLRGTIPPEFILTRVVRDYGSGNDDVSCRMHHSKNTSSVAKSGNGIICYIADYLPVGKEVQFSLLINHQPKNIVSDMIRIKDGELTNFVSEFRIFSDIEEKNQEDNGDLWILKPLIRSDTLLLSTATPDSSVIWINDTNSLMKAKKVLGQPFNSTTDKDSQVKFSPSDYVGPQITHTYAIINVGPSPIDNAEVTFSWPTHFNGLPLTLFRDEITTIGPAECQPLEDDLTLSYYLENPLTPKMHLEESVEALERTKRNAGSEKNYFDLTDKLNNHKLNDTDEKIMNIDCTTAECVHIRCNIGPLLMKEEVTIEINAVAIATFFNTFDDRKFLFTSQAVFEYPFLGVRNISQTETFLSIKSLEKSTSELIMEKWWILVIACIAGALILCLIVILLYKVGFFKRKRISRGVLCTPLEKLNASFVPENSMSEIHVSNPTPIEQRKTLN